jgi:hypothetical protein
MRLRTEYTCRFTASLVYMPMQDRWLFAQAHLSMGIPDSSLDI